jgi:hypothetical protein
VLKEPALELRVAGSERADQAVRIVLSWKVDGLSFLQRWWKVLLAALGLLVLAVIIAGYVTPHRFDRYVALVFTPEQDELDEQSPQPISRWPGVGIGFYRDAQAFLSASYRVSGDSKGAVAQLRALRRGVQVLPCTGSPLWREAADRDWEAVPETGLKVRAGDVFRVGEQGPFFRISTRRGGEA